jgi:hypothetical protein
MRKTTPNKSEHCELTVTQERAIEALIAGMTDGEAAVAAGVSRGRVNLWRNHSPVFQAALHARRAALRAASLGRMRGLLPRALDAIEHALTANPPDTRVALRIVELTGISPEELSRVGPATPEAVLDAEVRRRRGPFGLLMDDEVSGLERARVQQEWHAMMSDGEEDEK